MTETKDTLTPIGTLRFFEPVFAGEAAFAVGIYEDAEKHRLINATDYTVRGIIQLPRQRFY